MALTLAISIGYLAQPKGSAPWGTSQFVGRPTITRKTQSKSVLRSLKTTKWLYHYHLAESTAGRQVFQGPKFLKSKKNGLRSGAAKPPAHNRKTILPTKLPDFICCMAAA